MQRYTSRLAVDLDIPPLPPAAPFKGKEMNRHLYALVMMNVKETVHDGVRSYSAPHIV